MGVRRKLNGILVDPEFQKGTQLKSLRFFPGINFRSTVLSCSLPGKGILGSFHCEKTMGARLSRKVAADTHEASRRLVLQSKLLSTIERKGTSTDAGGGGGVRIGNVLGQKGCFCSDEVQSYTHLTGDSNPIHSSASAAREAGFEACVVPGMLCGSLFPAIIGSRFAGAVYVSQDLKFKAPLLVGESFLAEVEVRTIVRLRHHAKVSFFTRCVKGREESSTILVDGQAVALVPMSVIAD